MHLWHTAVDGTDLGTFGPERRGDPTTDDWEHRLSPDGSEVVFTRVDMPNDFWYTLMIRDLVTGEERVVTANEREPEHPDWSPDGRSIIYNTLHLPDSTESKEQIELVPADDPTAAPVVLYSYSVDYKPVYSPDGTIGGAARGACASWAPTAPTSA